MHEIRVKAPAGMGPEIAAVALKTGIAEVSMSSLTVLEAQRERQVDMVSVEVATPQAKAFIDALFAHSSFDPHSWSITSRELRAIFSRQPARQITRPMPEPAIDVFEDLWQLSHVTSSYVARAFGAAVLLAYGMMGNRPTPIIVAALFLPFLSIVLALSFGLWSGDAPLARQGIAALCVSIVCSVMGGALVAAIHGPPMAYSDFEKPLVSFGISAVIGMAAGLASADDAGRRYLIGVAAAVQYAVFPVWFGISLVLGFPPANVTRERLLTLGINIVTIAAGGAAAYALVGMRREEVRRFIHSKFWRNG